MDKIVCVVGPTASGKTRLSVLLALELNGEVISADSMQLYRSMDIGTAKPMAREMRGVPHHMIDVADPSEDYSAARYAHEASAALKGVQGRGRLPIIVGGTGFYIKALTEENGLSPRPENGELRSELARLCADAGPEAVHDMLREIDPESARRIHINNVKRVIRAIEICRETGMSVSDYQKTQKTEKLFNAVTIGLNITPRGALYDRIDKRVDEMIKSGLLGEVKELLNTGIREESTAMQAIGYKELIPVLRGQTELEMAVALIKQRSRNYAKRQLTWFKSDDKVAWFEYTGGDDFEQIFKKAKKYIKDKLKEE